MSASHFKTPVEVIFVLTPKTAEAVDPDRPAPKSCGKIVLELSCGVFFAEAFTGHDPFRGSGLEVYTILRVKVVGSGGVRHLAGWVESGQEGFQCHGKGRETLPRPDPREVIRPVESLDFFCGRKRLKNMMLRSTACCVRFLRLPHLSHANFCEIHEVTKANSHEVEAV